MIRAIIFDVGGVIIPNLDKIIDSDIRKSLGFSDRQFSDLWSKHIDKLVTGKLTEEDFWKLISDDVGRRLDLPEGSLFLREYIRNFHVDCRVIKMVIKLKNRGYTVGVISNSIALYSKYNRNVGLYDEFDYVVLSDEVGMLKPNKEIYAYILNLLKMNPEEVIFIDDKIENINSAKEVGLKAIKYNCFTELKKILKDLD